MRLYTLIIYIRQDINALPNYLCLIQVLTKTHDFFKTKEATFSKENVASIYLHIEFWIFTYQLLCRQSESTQYFSTFQWQNKCHPNAYYPF